MEWGVYGSRQRGHVGGSERVRTFDGDKSPARKR